MENILSIKRLLQQDNVTGCKYKSYALLIKIILIDQDNNKSTFTAIEIK